MKKIIVFLISSVFCQCQQQHQLVLHKEEINPKLNDLQKKLDINGDFINVFFESNFKNDNISIKCDKSMVFEKYISTDHTINLADYYSQKSSCEKLSISIGNEKFNLSRNKIGRYKYLYIAKEEKIINFTLSNTPRTYY